MHKDRRIGVVVPAYNGERLIGDTLRGMPDWVDRVYLWWTMAARTGPARLQPR